MIVLHAKNRIFTLLNYVYASFFCNTYSYLLNLFNILHELHWWVYGLLQKRAGYETLQINSYINDYLYSKTNQILR